MTSVSLDRIADALGMNVKRGADIHEYATVDSINADGSYQVLFNASFTTTRAAKLCEAEASDRVLCVISNGQTAAIARVGGDIPDPRADYVVEQGTSGQWFYRKWDSGVAECWGDHSHPSVAVTSKSGNAWYSGEIHEDFPNGLFNATPKYCDFSLNPSGGASVEVGSGLDATRTQSIWLMRVESGSTINVWLQVHAIGTWK